MAPIITKRVTAGVPGYVASTKIIVQYRRSFEHFEAYAGP
jgi:hypothetical protein